MTCGKCSYFNQDDTSLSVCMLHRRYTSPEWTCGKWRELAYQATNDMEVGDAAAQEAEDTAE